MEQTAEAKLCDPNDGTRKVGAASDNSAVTLSWGDTFEHLVRSKYCLFGDDQTIAKVVPEVYRANHLKGEEPKYYADRTYRLPAASDLVSLHGRSYPEREPAHPPAEKIIDIGMVPTVESLSVDKTNIVTFPKAVSAANPTLSVGEASSILFKSLPQNIGTALIDNAKENWGSLLVDAGIGLAAGVTLAALKRNPTLLGRAVGKIAGNETAAALGESWAPAVKSGLNKLPWIMGGIAAVDLGHRIYSPTHDLMMHPENRDIDEKLFAHNLGSMVESYTVAGVTGVVGARFSWARTAPYVNRAAEVDFSAQQKWAEANPGKLGKAAKAHEQQGYHEWTFQEEKQMTPDGDVHTEYKKLFPEDERQPVEGSGGYNEKFAMGANKLYTLRDGKGQLLAAHILGVHEQPDPLPVSRGIARDFMGWLKGEKPPTVQSMHGDFVFVREDLQSKGIGSDMYNRVVDSIQKDAAQQGKRLVALTGEMEAPEEPATALMKMATERQPNATLPDHQVDLLGYGRSTLAKMRAEYPNIQDADPVALGRKFLSGFGDKAVTREAAETAGENLKVLDERLRRQEFYWALPKPKVDSGIKWAIQDMNDLDSDFRGQAHWTAVVFDPKRFSPVETGHAFMVDEAGYTLDPMHPRVQEFKANNNYYAPSRIGSLSVASAGAGTVSIKELAKQYDDKH